jgi:hypothetical protein
MLIFQIIHRLAARTLAVVLLVGLSHTSQAQTPLQEVIVSGDVSVSLPFVSGGTFVSSDASLQRIDVDAMVSTGGIVIGFGNSGGVFDLPWAVDAYDAESDAFSIDIAAEVDISGGPTLFIRPGEIYNRSGTRLYDPVAAGLPANVNVDALSVDPISGDLLLSFANWVPGQFITPADIMRWNGSTLTIYFDGFRVPRNLNLDAAHVLENGNILMSFDTSGSIDGIGFNDEDVLASDPVADDFELAFLPAVLDQSWVGADSDALSATVAVQGGLVRFTVTLVDRMENEGNVVLNVERVGGSEQATAFRVQTISGTAMAGSDFGSVNQLLNWDDGDMSNRSVTIPIINDGAAEAPAEQFTVSLSKESGSADPGAPTLVTITIYDNETVVFADGFEGAP